MADKSRNICSNQCFVFPLMCSQAFFKLSHSRNINTGVCVIKMGLILLDEAVVSVLFQAAAGLPWREGFAQEKAPDGSL